MTTVVSPRLERQLRLDVQGAQAAVRQLVCGASEEEVSHGVITELNRRTQAKAAQMYRELPAIGRHAERVRVADKEGGGEWGNRVHPVSYHYWGQRLGYECWSDAEFTREYHRDNCYCRTRNTTTHTTVGYVRGMEAAKGFLRRTGRIYTQA